ncbi:MAG: cystathionine beta-synthase [Luteibaculaceae bacterium]|jgi:cystathionine beta-synthase
MKYFNNILETIGNTPLVKLNKVVPDAPCTVLAKVETTNPGNSVKDRMALQMINDAEKQGLLKPGGTIVEGTSGNTGMGLALVAIQRGYRVIFTLADKQSKEKIDILRAMGAEVHVCPTAVAPEDPRSYYSLAQRLAQEIPGAWYVNQYDNPSNAKAHYLSTGPEIWEQTEGKITHFVVGVGTGGTISGVGKYLKEKNPNIQIWGIDTYGSVFKKYHETGVFDENEIYPYITEGIGEDILPENVDFKVIDKFEKVTDKDGAVMTRRLAREEGIFVGNSAGSAVCGINQLASHLKSEDVLVVLFHDHGSRYVGKIFNDDWMRERGFLERTPMMAEDLIRNQAPAVGANIEEPVRKVIDTLTSLNISQIPVLDGDTIVGSIEEKSLLQKVIANPNLVYAPIKDVMDSPFPEVALNCSIHDMGASISKGAKAVLVKDPTGQSYILTSHDLIKALA